MEEFTRERHINCEGKFITSFNEDIEIWNKEPIWDSKVGAYNGRVDSVKNDINLLTSMSVKEFKRKYRMKLSYGAMVPVLGIIYD